MSQASHANISDFEGRLERCTFKKIEGWAWDKNNDQPVMVNIFIDGGLICTVVADLLRGDLQRKGKRNGYCAFSVTLPDDCVDGRRHSVRAVILHSEPQFILGDLTSDPGEDDASFRKTQSTAFLYRPTAPHKNTTARALIGKENWLFLADDSNRVRDQIAGRFPVSPTMKDNYRTIFDERRRKFRDLGVPYLFFIAPSKERVCSEYLPSGMPIDFEMMPANVIRRFLEEDGSHLIPLDTAVRDEHMRRETFYRTDTHWNYIGAHCAYQEIIKTTAEVVDCGQPHTRADFGSRIIRNYRGDLANKEKVAFAGEEYPLLSISPTSIDSTMLFQENVEELFDPSGDVFNIKVADHLKVSPFRATLVLGNKNKTLPKALVFRDSFTSPLAPMMARHFREVIYVWRPDILFSLIESEKPDIVIHIMVDRFMARPQANIW